MTVTMNGEANGEVAGSSSTISQPQPPSDKDDPQSFKKARYSWQIKGRRWHKRHCHKRALHLQKGPPDNPPPRPVPSIPDTLAAEAVPTEPDESLIPKVSQTDPAKKAWQSRQFAQGVIDNAINKVLGDMGLVPPQPDVFAGLCEGYVNAQNIVNEGVSEAIRQQGLQRRHKADDVWRVNAMEAGPSDANMETEGGGNRSSEDSDSKDENYLDGDSSQQCEELLDTAVSCAINQKGLGMFPMSY